MEAQQKPEGLKRLQAGVKPLQKRTVTLAPKGRQNVLPRLWSQCPFGATPQRCV